LIPHIGLYLLLGIILWNYFAEVTSGSVGAIVGRGDLLRKINFPKYVIVVAISLSAMVNLALNFIIFAIAMAFNHVGVGLHTLWLIPLLVELSILAIGLGFLLSALFVRFRDISYIWEVIMQAAFYATPILYVLSEIPRKAAKLMVLNPMAQIIQDARHAVVTDKALTIGGLYPEHKLIWLLPIGLSVVLAALSALYFRSRSKYFAEEI
jgi:ABC-2 type transport system permease protein